MHRATPNLDADYGVVAMHSISTRALKAALSIVTAKMALMRTAHASLEEPRRCELRFAPIKQIKANGEVSSFDEGQSASQNLHQLSSLRQ